MDANATARAGSALHHVFPRPATNALAPAPAPRLGLMAAQALWLGLAGAWVEMAVVLAHRAAVGTVTRVSYRHNWYLVPLGVPAHLAVFAAWFALVGLLWGRRSRRRWLDPAMTAAGLFLAAVSPLLAIEELYWPCSLVLAAGFALRAGSWWMRRREGVLRRTLPAMGGVSALLVVASFAWVRTAEVRALSALPAARSGSPNVVLLVLDTVRADHLSLYGYARETTPHLKGLAGRSIVFDLARAPAPWTLPSHASMFTGRWPHELSVDIDRPLDASHPTLAEFLARNGYATGGFTGNTFYTNAWFGLDRGFARYEDARENLTISVQETLRCAALGRALMPVAVWARLWPSTGQYPARKRAEGLRKDALAWVDRRSPGRPFFLFLNYFDAHDPYIVPPEFPVKYSWPDRLAVHQANRRYNGHAAQDDARPTSRPPGDPKLTQVVLDAYDDCLRYVDDQIARLLADLERRGLDRDTWVIVTADHGEQFGDHGHYRHGGSLYRGEIDVPLVIIPPLGVQAKRVPDPVSPRDLPATIADLVGLASSSPFPGRSLRRFWDGQGGDVSPGEAPLSELKIPANHLKAKGEAAIDRYRAALVDRDRVYHRSPIEPEELYDSSDRAEGQNLVPRPEEAKTLNHFRPLIDRLRFP